MMKWSPDELDCKVAELINQCADRVIGEFEEEIMNRLRTLVKVRIDEFFALNHSQAVPVTEEGQNVLNLQDVQPLQSENLQAPQEIYYGFGILDCNGFDPSPILGMEDSRCSLIQEGDLGMLVCFVPQAEYNEASLHKHLEDISWVESHAQRHEEVLLAVLKEHSFVPLPFCTIFTQKTHIQIELKEKCQLIQDELNNLRDAVEMHVKLFINPQILLMKIQENMPYPNEQSGESYFKKRQWEKKTAEKMETITDHYGELLYQEIKNCARNCHLLDSNGVTVPDELKLIFAAQLLLPKDQNEILNTIIDHFDKQYDELGFILEISGPWPPYHFSSLNEEDLCHE